MDDRPRKKRFTIKTNLWLVVSEITNVLITSNHAVGKTSGNALGKTSQWELYYCHEYRSLGLKMNFLNVN